MNRERSVRAQELDQHFRLRHDRHATVEEEIQRVAATEPAEATAIKAGECAA
jgi:hypothetical protein